MNKRETALEIIKIEYAKHGKETRESMGSYVGNRISAEVRNGAVKRGLKMPLHQFVLYSLWFIPRDFIGKYYWRIFVRGKCAIKGCNRHYSCGGNLPDDACEWYCKRCDAEGINHVVYTHELFYPDSPLRNFWGALRGR